MFKCVKPLPPRANNAVFSEIFTDGSSSERELQFIRHERDKQRPDDESGYVSALSGDSGSPYWITEEREDGSFKNTLVAIHNSNLGVPGKNKAVYINEAKYQCRHSATKITEDIKLWIKKMGQN